MLSSGINLHNIMDCFRGKTVINFYQRSNCLDIANRRILCDLIIDEVFNKGWRLRTKDIPIICEKIVEMFPTEDMLDGDDFESFQLSIESSFSDELAAVNGEDNLDNWEYLEDDVGYHEANNNYNSLSQEQRKITEAIITTFKEHSILWDTKDRDYKNTLKQEEAYNDVTQQVNERMKTQFEVLDIKEEINKLKNIFRNEQKMLNNLSQSFHDKDDKGQEHVNAENVELIEILKLPQTSWLYEAMNFLKDHILGEKKRSKRGTKALATNNKSGLPLPKLSTDENLQLIQLYKSYPCLWDVNHIGYRFKNQRLESLKELLDAVNTQMTFDITLDDLQKKLYYIRYAFTQEKHRQLECERLHKDYYAKCTLYEELLFLQNSVGPFKCEYCDQQFNGPDQYKMHKSTHDGSMPYSCPICHKGFMKIGNCTVHLRRHTKDYQFTCKDCGKSYATSTELSVHMRHHTGERPYICDVCGQSFRTWTLFDSHKRRHDKKRTHTCTICMKAFYESNKLKDHIKSHMNVRDKICNICGKTFTCTKYLSQHKQIHAKEKAYSCKICGKTFAQYSGLSGHLKTHGTALRMAAEDILVAEC